MRRNRRRRRNSYMRASADRTIRYRKSRRKNSYTAEKGILAAVVVLVLLVITGSIWWLRHPDEEGIWVPSDAATESASEPISESTETGASEETGESNGDDTSGDTAQTQEQESQSGEMSQEPVAGDSDWNYRSEDRPKVKGIYVTGPRAGSAAFDDLLTLVDTTELNAMVIDVKNDGGEITYKMDLEMAGAMGACINYIPNMEGFMQQLKEHNVYTIARIVCFKDPYLAANHPELALLRANGSAVVDGHGVAWVNPYKEAVWKYLVDVAKKAAEIGFDEIQFDYVRFPLGTEAEDAQYGVDMAAYPKEQAIEDFLQYAVDELHAIGIPVTADVFGTIIDNETDAVRVGQDYAALGEILDAICPMVYPSHYGPGVFGLAVPDAQPYETILAAMRDSVADLAGIPAEKQAVVRPWLQDFTASWVSGHISYGGEQVRSQIQAVYDAGYEEWILWNSSNRYSADGLY